MVTSRVLSPQLSEDFWLSRLKDAKSSGLYLPQAGCNDRSGSFGEQSFEIPPDLEELISAKAHGIAVNEFKIFLASVGLLVRMYTGRNDVVIASAPLENFGMNEMSLCFFKLSVPLEITVREFFRSIHEELNTVVNQTSFDKASFLKKWHDVCYDDAGNLFSYGVIYDRIQKEINAGERLELLFNIQNAASLKLTIEYNTDLYPSEFVSQLAAGFFQLMRSILSTPDALLSEIEVLDNEQRQLYLSGFNRSSIEARPFRSVIALFEANVRLHPHDVALVAGNMVLTYEELNNEANKIAHYIAAEGEIGKQGLVAVMMDKSWELMATLIAILKLGAAYVPLDPQYPDGQKNAIVQDCNCSVLVTHSSHWAAAQHLAVKKVINVTAHTCNDTDNPDVPILPFDLAYIIYTSGSTGKPKGVMIEHFGITNLLCWQNQEYDFKKNRNILQLTNVIVDIALIDIFTALHNGNTLFVPSYETVMSKERFLQYLEVNKINFLQIVPDMLRNYLADEPKVDSLDLILCGGDKLTDKLKEQILSKGYTLYDNYGQTEITVDVLISRCTPEKFWFDNQVAMFDVHILDQRNKLVPIGALGEICAHGPGVARGYVNQPELTHEKFVDHPFKQGAKIYKSGDLGVRLLNGGIAFSGRTDSQVKVNGYRIELGAIEKRLLSFDGVDSAVVVVRGQDEKYLIAFFTANARKTATQLRKHLKEVFPGYMIPQYFIQMEKFPLLSNGKINRKALPDYAAAMVGADAEYKAPVSMRESILVDIFCNVLDRPRVGISDDFFQLGGHSLRAVKLITSIFKRLDIDLSIKDIFNNPTVEKLANVIEGKVREKEIPIPKVPSQSSYEVSNAQRRLWMIDHLGFERKAFNMPHVFEFKGNFDFESFAKAFYRVVERHEILRTCFAKIKGNPQQVIHPFSFAKYSIDYLDVSDLDHETFLDTYLTEQAKFYFDLSSSPLWNARMFKLAPDRYIFLFNIHHILADGWSIEVMSRDIFPLYNSYRTGDLDFELKPLPVQYKDYALWQKHMLEGVEGERLKQYWLNQFADDVPVLDLKTDFPRPKIKTNNGDINIASIEASVQSGIHDICAAEGISIFMFFQAVVKILLSKHSGQQDIVTGTPTAGRRHSALLDQVGNYINIIALRTNVKSQYTFRELLHKIRIDTLNAYEHDAYPIDTLVRDLNLKFDASRSPIFDVLIQMQNLEFINESEIGMQGVEVLFVQPYYKVSKYDLTFTFTVKHQKGIDIAIEYNVDLFTAGRVQQFQNDLQAIIHAVVGNRDCLLSSIQLTDDEMAMEHTDFLRSITSA